MASRDDILRAVRAQPRPPAEPPSLNQAWTSYADRRGQFAAVLEAVGGRAVFVADLAALNRALDELPVYTQARKVVSLVSGAGRANVDLDTIDDPHALADVDFALMPGRFGVAENGAVWVADEGVKQRAIWFLV